MLLDLETLIERFGLTITGVLHIGAHQAEEYEVYERLGVPKVLWVEANPELARELIKRFGKNNPRHMVETKAICNANKTVELNIANNGQSSSLLALGSHREHHPEVDYVDTVLVEGTTIETLLRSRQAASLNFWNLDIQGGELDALSSARSALNMADYIYTEVNREEVYAGCGLIGDLDDLLEAEGFERVATQWTPFEWGDALYIHRSHL